VRDLLINLQLLKQFSPAQGRIARDYESDDIGSPSQINNAEERLENEIDCTPIPNKTSRILSLL
jgi:hypothetical protein